MRLSNRFILIFGALACAVGAFFFSRAFSEKPILIQSEESRTREDGAVFNRIRFIRGKDKDVWMMQQSHQGVHAGGDGWDRLAIVVDKSGSQKTARFYQFESGPLEWSENLKRKEYRVSCFFCHTNGPRAIRPVHSSTEAPLSWTEKLQVMAWNLRIKSYGRVLEHSSHAEEDGHLRVPFRLRTSLENDPLNVATCLNCHKESGLFARGPLTRQNAMTIGFMVSQQHMPPLWFRLPLADQKRIQSFLKGF